MAKNDIKPEYMRFADKLRTEIKKKGLTQSKVGEAIGAKGVTVGSWCSGRSAPNEDTVRGLEDLLELKDGTLGKLLPEDRRQRPGKKKPAQSSPTACQLSRKESQEQPAPKKNTEAAAEPSAAQPAQKKIAREKAAVVREVTFSESTDARRMPERKAPELMNLPWCMPAQVGHMRKVLDRYEAAAYDYLIETCKNENNNITMAKRDFWGYARDDFKAVRAALADLEHELRCLLGLPG